MKVRVIVALVAAFVVLSSGLGTGARWMQEGKFSDQPITVTSGRLGISLGETSLTVSSKYPTDTRYANLSSCPSVPQGFRKCARVSKSQLQSFTFMRGDRISIDSSFTVTASGKNLRYLISPKPQSSTLPKWWVASAPTVPAGPLSGTRTISTTRTVEFTGPATASEWPNIFAEISFPELVVRTVQENR